MKQNQYSKTTSNSLVKIKILTLAFLLCLTNIRVNAQTENGVTYCAATFAFCACSSCSQSFPFGVSQCTIGTLNSTGLACGAPFYVSTSSGNVTAGSTYTLTVGRNTTGYSVFVTVFADWNHNGLFTDAGETILASGTYGSSTTRSGSVTVPAGAYIGTTSIRVLNRFNAGATNPCQTTGQGEYKDFNITIGASCSAPTTQATMGSFSGLTTSSVGVNWTRGNGTGGVVVVAHATTAVSAFPVSGTDYTATQNAAFASGANLGSANYVVYAGTGTSVNVTALTGGTTYYFSVFEYNTVALCYNLTGSSGNVAIPTCTPPTIPASGQSSANITTSQADINWTANGDGNGGVIVFLKQGSAITTDPTQTTNYNANSVFGSGDQIGATGARAVYKGTGSTVTVTGLTTNLTYYYAIYAFHSTTNCYASAATGNFTTTNSQMTTTAQVVTQVSVAAVTPSSTNNQILQLRMDCGTGTAPSLVMNQLFFTTAATNGGTTNPADIANAKVYYTGTSATFATTTQYGSTVVSPNGAFIVSGATTLVPGSNYFWLTYDITASPTIGDFVDAKLSTIDVGAILTPSGDPAGNRQITLTYCTPTAMGGSPCGAAGNIYFSSATLSGTTFYSGGTCVSTSPYYANLSGSVIASALTGTSYTLTVNSAAATSGYISTYAAWVDWDNNGTFGNNANEIIIPTNTNIAAGAPLTFTSTSFVPPSAGNFRMRVAVWGGEFSNVTITGPCTGSSSYYGEWKDFTISVAAGSTPMTYSSSTTTQNTSPAPPNINNQQIVGLQVVTSGALTPISLTSLTFNTNGSTNITGDATNARVFYTGNNGTYSAVGQFGSTIANPNGSYTVTGSQILSPGTNFFWIAYDVPSSATIGNNLDAECTSIIVGGTTYTPSITAPTGARPIGLVYCIPSAGATACSLGGDDVITTVTLTGTGSTFNFTGGTCLTPYPNNYQINPYSGNVNQGGSYTTTMIKSGSSYGARFMAWVDWDNDGNFTGVNDKIMDVTQSAASATGSAFTVPALAPAGAHRMRTWIGYTGTIVTSDITGVVTACEVLSGSNNQGEVRDFTVIVVAGCSAPVFTTCPGNISLNTAPGLCTAVGTYTTAVSGTTPTVTYAFTGATTASGSGDGSGSAFNIGTTVVTVTATNGCGTAPCTYNVVVTDNQNPVPNVASLPNITGECSASATAPTATDNCAGTVTVTTVDPTSYSSQGTFTIHWNYSDGNGNTATQNQIVIVDDVTNPVPSLATLPDITGECSASVSTAPAATDNCSGTITATTTDPTSYSTQGTFVIHWTYDDGNGNVVTQNQNVIVDDVSNPVPVIAVLPDITGECSATASTAPTATDGCSPTTITGTTTDPLTYNTQGAFVIHWTYDDGNGNVVTQNQNVIVDDVTNPVPVIASLPDVTGECSATATAPTATDNCAGTVTATTTDPTSYSTQGSFVIQWTYDDGNGNVITQNQNVIIDDVTNPTINGCPGNISSCNPVVSWTAPTANDNCGTASLSSTHNPGATFPLGNTTVTYTADDGNGNTAVCSFIVTVKENPTVVISNNSSICLGQSATVHLVFTGTGPWNYTISDGTQNVSGSTSSNPFNVLITPATAGVHNYTVTVLSDVNCPGSGSGTAVVAVSSALPANSIGNVNGPTEACNGTVVSMSTNVVTGQNITYSWNTGTNSSVVKFSTNAGGPFVTGPFSTTSPSVYAQFGVLSGSSGYNVCVQAVNGCGSTNNKCTWIRGVVGVPGTIVGSTVACPNDIKSYSCGLSGGATVYSWTLAGSSSPVTSGQGTPSVGVTFPVGFVSGQLCVTAALSCGGSSISAPRCMTISNAPAVPGSMTGPSKVCPGATGVVFSIAAVTNATGYNWTTPAGTTITSGQNTTSITVNFPASYTGAPPVCVSALSPCASSVARCKTVGTNLPGQPGSITGPTTGVCNSTVQYSISNVTLATSYTWTIPAGSTSFVGQGSTSIQFTVPTPFTSGQVTVVANTTACTPGTSVPRTITINGAPGQPGVIAAFPSAWCDGGFVNFSITPASPLPVYQWVVTNGSIDAGQNSNNIDVTWGTGAGTVKVRATNTCGVSSYRTLNTSSVCRIEQNQSADDLQQLSIYPNPAHDKVMVEIKNNTEQQTIIKITDLAGKLIFSEKVQLNEGISTLEIDITHFAKGAYVFSAESRNGTERQRIMIQ